jgi:hypothetical protein
MRWDFEGELNGSDTSPLLTIGSDEWRVHVLGVVRVQRDAFVQIAVLGRRVCMLTVRMRDAMVPGVTGVRLLDTVAEWLQSGDTRSDVYLELRDVADDTC